MTDEDRHDAGMRVRREVLGDAYVDRATANATALTAPFQTYVTRAAWGEVWARPELNRRTRSLVTLALLAALGHDRELAVHVRAALRNGVTPAEIVEVLMHTAVYAGAPAANSAIHVAQDTLADLGVAEARADED